MAKDVKLTADSAREILRRENVDPDVANQILAELLDASKSATPWWVIVLKTLAYLIGLLLAGYGTTAAACTLMAM